jgi:hypothetical protein
MMHIQIPLKLLKEYVHLVAFSPADPLNSTRSVKKPELPDSNVRLTLDRLCMLLDAHVQAYFNFYRGF